jgi:hypothetical protein
MVYRFLLQQNHPLYRHILLGIGFERFMACETSFFITFGTMWPTDLTNLFLLVESINTFAVGSIFNKVVDMITNFAMSFILASKEFN